MADTGAFPGTGAPPDTGGGAGTTQLTFLQVWNGVGGAGAPPSEDDVYGPNGPTTPPGQGTTLEQPPRVQRGTRVRRAQLHHPYPHPLVVAAMVQLFVTAAAAEAAAAVDESEDDGFTP